MEKEAYPFQVLIWVPSNDNKKSIFEKGFWMEMARCSTGKQSEEVALCLSLRHPQGVQCAALHTDDHGARFIGYKYIPESAKDLR